VEVWLEIKMKILEQLKEKRKSIEGMIERWEREIRRLKLDIKRDQEELEDINETIRILERR